VYLVNIEQIATQDTENVILVHVS